MNGQPEAGDHLLVQGRCPACNSSSLFLGAGGHVTCSRPDCTAPATADDLLHRGRPAPGAWLLGGARDQTIPQQVPRFTARPVSPEIERAATERARQAAEDHAKVSAWFDAHPTPDSAEQRLARLRDCASRLREHGHDAMSAQFVLNVIDGREQPAATDMTP